MPRRVPASVSATRASVEAMPSCVWVSGAPPAPAPDGLGREATWLGQAEVHHLHVPLRRQHHVGGLQIAMDEASPMRGVEGLGQLVRDVEHLAHR